MLYKKNPKLTYKNLLYFQDIVNDELLCEKYPVVITIKINGIELWLDTNCTSKLVFLGLYIQQNKFHLFLLKYKNKLYFIKKYIYLSTYYKILWFQIKHIESNLYKPVLYNQKKLSNFIPVSDYNRIQDSSFYYLKNIQEFSCELFPVQDSIRNISQELISNQDSSQELNTESSQELTSESSQDSVQELSTESSQELSTESTTESSQESTTELSQELSQELTTESSQEVISNQESVQDLIQDSVQEVIFNQDSVQESCQISKLFIIHKYNIFYTLLFFTIGICKNNINK